MANAIWETARGTLIRFIVRPNSKEKKFIAHITPEAILVNLHSPAREGKANAELLKRVSKLLKVSSADISLVAGHKSREKTVLIAGMSAEDLTKRLMDVT
ncbi:MAG: DUF167 domain-containing protein [Candidatus Thorarchaeota archaeon]|jgi:uncharacterized protein (TIGR00251 family)